MPLVAVNDALFRREDELTASLAFTEVRGAPVLAGCTAVFECANVSHQPAGDHRLFIGQVLAYTDAKLPPLVFQAGHYRQLGEPL